MVSATCFSVSFSFNTSALTIFSSLSLHDALPISLELGHFVHPGLLDGHLAVLVGDPEVDRKSTRLNSSHERISYAVFCLRKNRRRNRILGEATRGPPIPPSRMYVKLIRRNDSRGE